MSAPSARTRLALLGVVIVIATVIAFVLQPSQQDVEDTFGGDGVVGPLIFALAYALLVIAFVPATPLTLASGALYGVAGGFAVTMAGASLGALGAFALARRSTRGALESTSGPRLAAIEKRLSGRGLLALLVLRLIPIVPFNGLNYAAGASTIGVRDYVIATVLGIAPGALAYVALGAGADDPASPLFIGAGLLAIALAIGAHTLSRRVAGDALPEERDGEEADGGSSQAESGRDMRRLGWSAAFFAAAVAVLAALALLGLFH